MDKKDVALALRLCAGNDANDSYCVVCPYSDNGHPCDMRYLLNDAADLIDGVTGANDDESMRITLEIPNTASAMVISMTYGDDGLLSVAGVPKNKMKDGAVVRFSKEGDAQ